MISNGLISEVELFPYQKQGIEFLSKKNWALLADDMGLGKTCQSIKAAEAVNAERILVVCRAVARFNWRDEFNKFGTRGCRLPIRFIFGRDDCLNFTSPGVSIVSYEGLPHVLSSSSFSTGFKFDLAIVDEIHYAKEPTAKRTKNIFGADGLVRRTKRLWGLTGTPTPNHFGELWPLLYTFGATRIGYTDFTELFCNINRTGFGDQIVGTKTDKKSLESIHELLKTVSLRRTKEEVNLEMPPVTYGNFAVEKSPVDVSMHAGFCHYTIPASRINELNAKLEKEQGIVDAVLASGKMGDELLALILASAQSVTTLRRYTALQKAPAVIDLIAAELMSDQYRKIVIFAIHKDPIFALREGLKKFGAVTLFGGTDPEKRELNIHKFQTQSKTRVMICNIKAAGTSINLTAANQVAFLEQEWSPGDNAQAIARCHRIGQKESVNVRVFALADSIDARVVLILEKKIKEIDQIYSKTVDVESLF